MKFLLLSVAPLVAAAAITPLMWKDVVAQEVAFPTDYKSGVLYNIVDREDRTEVHQQYKPQSSRGRQGRQAAAARHCHYQC